MFKDIKIIGFDADDTLWHNEPFFRAAEKRLLELLEGYGAPDYLAKELLAVEVKNMPLYGYGIKAFTLSMLETALKISNNTLPAQTAAAILELGQSMLKKPVVLLDGVQEVLEILGARYKLVVATKGDLLDQQRKLTKSGLVKYLHHIEVMSEKDEENYLKLLKYLNVKPQNFLMIGNSLKSDILPVLNIGGCALHIPHPDTWTYEQADPGEIKNKNFAAAGKIKDILKFL
ncbi:MAG: HAD hydrolase-like protein [Elusimicrobiota bacterium]|nr:HAD hydrolase-like protein [Elusimicrobiota bacterium]